jgi:hypothetical protein
MHGLSWRWGGGGGGMILVMMEAATGMPLRLAW